MIKVNRKQTVLKKITKEEDSYVDASPAERVSFIWDLTKEIWSLKDKNSAERRLQRHIAKLNKKKN